MFICNLHCQLFLRISGNMLHKKHVPMQNFPLYLKKAVEIKYTFKKTFYVVSVSVFMFFILFVKPIRSLLIQRIRAGSSFRLLAFKTFYRQKKDGYQSMSHSQSAILFSLQFSQLGQTTIDLLVSYCGGSMLKTMPYYSIE